MKRNRKYLSLILALTLVFSMVPVGSYAVSKPGKVTIKKSTVAKKDGVSLTITLSKVPKCSGIRLCCVKDGKLVKLKTVKYSKKLAKNKKITYKINKSKDGSNGAYNFVVQSYNTYKQYYNSKTKKWVTKKPKKSQWKGKKTKTAYKYCNASTKDAITIIYKDEPEEKDKTKDNNQPAGGGGSPAPSGGGGGGGSAPSGGGGGGTPSTPSSPTVDIGPSDDVIEDTPKEETKKESGSMEKADQESKDATTGRF